MNGVDVGSAVSSQADVLWFILPSVVVMVVIVLLKIDEDRNKVQFISLILLMGCLLASIFVNTENRSSKVQMRDMISKHYQVDYPNSESFPNRGSRVELSLESKNGDSETLKLYQNVVVKRSEDDIVTLWVPKTEGSTEFVELGSDADALEHESPEKEKN